MSLVPPYQTFCNLLTDNRLPFVPDEPLVCPPRTSRLSPTRVSFVPHAGLTHYLID